MYEKRFSVIFIMGIKRNMRPILERITHKRLFLVIVLLLLSGALLPYMVFKENEITPYSVTYYGWEWFSFWFISGFSLLILLISLSARIALRLLVIRLLLILVFPFLLLTTIFGDSNTTLGHLYPGILLIGSYISYVALILTAIYGILHSRKSYPIYKKMLKEYTKQSSDILDEF